MQRYKTQAEKFGVTLKIVESWSAFKALSGKWESWNPPAHRGYKSAGAGFMACMHPSWACGFQRGSTILAVRLEVGLYAIFFSK